MPEMCMETSCTKRQRRQWGGDAARTLCSGAVRAHGPVLHPPLHEGLGEKVRGRWCQMAVEVFSSFQEESIGPKTSKPQP